MNPPDQPEFPATSTPNPEEESARASMPSSDDDSASAESSRPVGPDLRAWARRLLVCNPFFLCSAALVLFGVGRLSTDDRLFVSDVQNLCFNFFSLQFYSVTLIATALLLVRRRIWYDSALLVVLDHTLVLVPFVLISHASLESLGLAWTLISTGLLLLGSRALAIRRRYPEFHLPGRALVLGAVLLAANVALPLLARATLDRDVLDWEIPNRLLWLYAMPIIAAGANGLPRPDPRRHGGPGPGRPWLPLLIYGLWTTGSGVHVWCLSHICGLPFHPSLLAPALLAAGWTLHRRLTDCLREPPVPTQVVSLIVTAVIPLLAYGQPAVFLTLAAFNFTVYAAVWLRPGSSASLQPVARHLAILTFALLVSAVPPGWIRPYYRPVSEAQLVAMAVAFFLMLHAIGSRRPELGLIGAAAFGLTLFGVFRPPSPHLGWQGTMVFLMLHSLRWGDRWEASLHPLRALALGAWCLETLIAARAAVPVDAVGLGAATMVLLPWGWRWWKTRERIAMLQVFASGLVALAAPANWSRHWAQQHSSPGLSALAGSFLLLAIGTWLALRRHRQPAAGE